MTRRLKLNPPLTLTVIFWGLNYVAMKVLYHQTEPAALALFRFVGVWLFLSLYCRAIGVSTKIPKEDRAMILLSGCTSMGLYMVPFLEGLKRTAPTNCSIILATAPIFTVLFSWLLRQEKSSLAAVIGSGVSFVGVATVISGSGVTGKADSLDGDLLTLLAAIMWAIATVIMRPLLKKYSGIQLFTMSLPGALPILVPYGLYSLHQHPQAMFSPLGWALLIHVTLLSGVVGFVCFYTGLQQTNAATTTTYQFFVPPMAALFSWIFLGNVMKPLQFLGLFVVIAGVWIVSAARQRLAKT